MIYNDAVKVFKGEEKDSWGIVTPSTLPVTYKALVTYHTEVKELVNGEGKKVVLTADILFKGKVDISENDSIDIGTGKQLKVLKIIPIKDLGSSQLFTKVVV